MDIKKYGKKVFRKAKTIIFRFKYESMWVMSYYFPIIKEIMTMKVIVEMYLNDCSIVPRFTDKESKELFYTRLYMDLTGLEDPFIQTIWKYKKNRKYVMYDLLGPMKQCGAKRVIVFGDGKDYKLNYSALKLCRIPVAAHCVLKKTKKVILLPKGEMVITGDELLKRQFNNCLVLISSQEQRKEIRNALRELNFPMERVFDPPNSYRPILAGFRNTQYFDVWEARPHEVFVDCGAFDGQTSILFSRWAKDYDAIYTLEPLPDIQDEIMRKTRDINKLTVYPVAAWNKNEELVFGIGANLSGSRVGFDGKSNNRTVVVQGRSLDSLIPGRISFLKMDIEGSELAAINGAEQLLRKWKPRLAISVYHRPKDILEIPLRILEIVPEYHFRIRHYSAGLYETVLYATVEDGVWLENQ